nr:PREDICTED: cyclin-dependent kinases regulatory subunit 1 [Apteryx mantelli mantelli]
MPVPAPREGGPRRREGDAGQGVPVPGARWGGHCLTEHLWHARHVMLPKDIAKLVPKTHLMSESEWRNLGVQQSQGWVHYMIHEPEPHILLFRRPLPKKPEK